MFNEDFYIAFAFLAVGIVFGVFALVQSIIKRRKRRAATHYNNPYPYGVEQAYLSENRINKGAPIRILSAIVSVVAIFVGTFVLTSGMLGLFDGGSSEPPSESHPTNRYAQGEVARIDGLEIALIETKEVSGNSSFAPSEGNIYLLVYFEITNTSNQDISLSTMLQFNAYVDNYKMPQNIWAKANEMVESGNFVDTLDTTLSAGRKIVGSIGYEVPENWVTIEIEFISDISRPSQKVTLCVNNPSD